MSTIKDFMNNLKDMANQAKNFSQNMPQGSYQDAHFERDSDGSYNLYYKPAEKVSFSKSFEPVVQMPEQMPKPVSEGSLNDFVKNFQTIMNDFNNDYANNKKSANKILNGSFLDNLREATGGNVSIEMDSNGTYNLYMTPEFYNKFHGSKKRK